MSLDSFILSLSCKNVPGIVAAVSTHLIIAQDVEPIAHRDTPDDLVRKGRDIERRVPARAVRHHLEDGILLNGAKTAVLTG